MNRIIIFFLLLISSITLSCKEEDRFVEPDYVLKKWAKSIEEQNYKNYCRYEAYPKREAVFREMYKDYFIADIMTTAVEEKDEKNIRKDHNGNSFASRSIFFEGAIVKRSSKKPYQIVRGDAVFIKLLDGKRKKDGWLISNRTMIRINR